VSRNGARIGIKQSRPASKYYMGHTWRDYRITAKNKKKVTG
jgi:hypothetical protein